jgi:phosphatidylserine/phosphatidylglycerophosphate/cardiolipin synthase-like enzyme
MHNKFILFSKTGTQKKVFVQSSANMLSSTDGANSGIQAWNNAVTIVDDDAVYDAYVNRFTAMVDGTDVGYVTASGPTAKVYFFPRAGTGTYYDSTIMDILNNVKCSGVNTSGGWGDDHITSIKVAMYKLTDLSVALKLWQLDDQGCVVYVARTERVKDDDDYPFETLNACTAHNGVVIDTFDDDKVGFLHSKYMIIDGFYDGHPNQNLVWTGSYNYAEDALRDNDESMLKLWDQSDIFQDFKDNFKTVQDDADLHSVARDCG